MQVRDYIKYHKKGDRHNGSGSGIFTRGRRIKTMKGLKKGMLLVNDSKQFKSTNIMKILKLDKLDGKVQGFYAIWIDPVKPSQRRLGSDKRFFKWDYMLKYDSFYIAKRLKVNPFKKKKKR